MSKAFTKEDGGEPAVLGRPVTRGGEPRPITARGHAALLARLRVLEESIAAIAPADAALRRPPLLHEREQLAATLADVRVQAAPAMPTVVSFGCRVRITGGRGERVLTLVGPDETEPRQGRISVLSPVGRALLGAAPGAEVELRRPGGAELVIVAAVEADER